MTDAEKAYQYFVIAVPENEEQAKAYFWARKALQSTLTPPNEWVRVKDCQYYQDAKTNKKGFLICPAFGMEITETDYCSYGVRMEVED